MARLGLKYLPPDGRIPPTPEDSEIFRRNIRRIMQWDSMMPAGNPRRLLKALRLATGDYLHF